MASNYDDVLGQLASAGLLVDHLVVGRMQRCKTEGDREKRGWYNLHEMRLDNGDELIVGSYGIWQGTNNNATKVDVRKAELSADQRDAMRKRLAEDRKRADAARQAEADKAAEAARKAWAKCTEAGHCEYLDRKGVGAHGVRFLPTGAMVIPMLDAANRIHGLQIIRPKAAPGATSRKLDKEFWPKGLAMRGHFHLIGMPTDLVLLTEGYATAASLYEATSIPVAAAFSANNLGPVAEALRKRYKGVRILICADDDAFSEGNPGVLAASTAALAVGGEWVAPVFADETARRAAFEAKGQKISDFNDLHAIEGLHAVRQQVQARLTALNWATGRSKAKQEAPPDVDRFQVTDKGVFHHGVDRDGKPTAPEWVCTRLDVEALTRDAEGNGWGYLLTFADPMGKPKQWAMPARMLAGDGGEYRAALLGMGLRLSSSARARNLLTQYIQTRQPSEHATCTDRVGWHGRSFVLPHETIGNEAERIVFQTDRALENTYRVRGTVEAWKERVAALCVGNSRLAFSVACAFAGAMLRPAGMESGGFHFRGDSSSGKTTALKVAASVFGGASYLQRWRTTDNALEAIAAQHCDGLLILDELAQVDPKTAGECAYMLANEQSKARLSQSAAPRARLNWRLLFLSAGELGLADHMAEGAKRARTGQEVRMADIPADAGKGMGAFEALHGHEGGAAFSQYLTGQAASVYGAAGHAWFQWLTEHADTLKARIKADTAALALQLVPDAASGQVHRVGARFALVGAAGELATEAGLTGWPQGEATRAARTCFSAWLSARGGIGNGEVGAMLRQVRQFLEAGGEGRFTWWHRAADDHSAKTLQRAGFRRMVNEQGEPIKNNAQHLGEYGDRMQPQAGEGTSSEYFLLPEVFRSEVCKGFAYEAVCKVLADHECLLMTEPGRFAKKVKLPGLGQTRCYHITAKIFEIDL